MKRTEEQLRKEAFVNAIRAMKIAQDSATGMCEYPENNIVLICVQEAIDNMKDRIEALVWIEREKDNAKECIREITDIFTDKSGIREKYIKNFCHAIEFDEPGMEKRI